VRPLHGHPVIALFNEPIRGSASKEFSTTGHIMLLGLAISSTGTLDGVAVNEHGEVTMIPPTAFTIDWRYVAESDRWMDLEVIRSGEADQG
jgi:hypothetical protein